VARASTGPHVVVGVDGSDESVAALMWACREASLRGVEVLAVLAVEAPSHRGGAHAIPPPRTGSGSWGGARQVLVRAVDEALGRFPGLKVRVNITEGLAARVLIDSAVDADMLVLGRVPHPDESSRSAGPVTRTCLRLASCPVVVVAPASTPAASESYV
jgi:nucleotide-binding universal stress UspA family protein